jgi:hypothetical protein
LAASIRTVQTKPAPEQAPDQAEKTEPGSALAVSVTSVGSGNEAEQVGPQLIPPGELVTVPVPAPASGW